MKVPSKKIRCSTRPTPALGVRHRKDLPLSSSVLHPSFHQSFSFLHHTVLPASSSFVQLLPLTGLSSSSRALIATSLSAIVAPISLLEELAPFVNQLTTDHQDLDQQEGPLTKALSHLPVNTSPSTAKACCPPVFWDGHTTTRPSASLSSLEVITATSNRACTAERRVAWNALVIWEIMALRRSTTMGWSDPASY